MPLQIYEGITDAWRGYENDGFKLRAWAFFNKSLDKDITKAIWDHAKPIDSAILIDKIPFSALPDLMLLHLDGLLEECAKLQRDSFDQFGHFLALEGCTSAIEKNNRLLWATERVIERILLEGWSCAWTWKDNENYAEAKAPAWLQELTEQATRVAQSGPRRR